MCSYGCFNITPLLSTVFTLMLISTHRNCTDHSKHHYLQITTKVTANRAILTKLWPGEFWHGDGEFKHQISLGHNFFHTHFSTIFLSKFVDWDLLYHQYNFCAQKWWGRHSFLLCPEGLPWWCGGRCCHPCGFVGCVFLHNFVSVEFKVEQKGQIPIRSM